MQGQSYAEGHEQRVCFSYVAVTMGLKRSGLWEGGFVLTHSSKRHSLRWWGSHAAEMQGVWAHRIGGQEAERK